MKLRWRGLPRVRRGTPPTPDDPHASNEWRIEFENGDCRILCLPSSFRILREYERAIRDYPDSPGLLWQYACALHEMGRTEDALGVIERALELEPAEPLDLLIWRTLVMIFESAGRIKEAESASRKAFQLQLDQERIPGSWASDTAQILLRPVEAYGAEAQPSIQSDGFSRG